MLSRLMHCLSKARPQLVENLSCHGKKGEGAIRAEGSGGGRVAAPSGVKGCARVQQSLSAPVIIKRHAPILCLINSMGVTNIHPVLFPRGAQSRARVKEPTADE